MAEHVSIIMPAYRCGATIATAVSSVLAADAVPGHGDLEIVIAADDGEDYSAQLAAAGVTDSRLVFTATASAGSGASAARNAALAVATGRFAATLDADDAFVPGKLARALPFVREHGLVSTALAVVDERGNLLRTIGDRADGPLAAGDYKFTNFSMDSMILWDRRRADPRYDETLPCMTDLDFVMRLFATIPACFHLGEPLHFYRKLTRSISNGPEAAARMLIAKTRLRARLARGYYRFADPDAAAGLDAFLVTSLEAERRHAASSGAVSGIFEDTIASLLRPAPRVLDRESLPLEGRKGS